MGGDGTRFTGGSQGDAGTSRALAAALSSSLRDAVAGARWYQGKGSRLDSIELLDHVTVPESGGGVLAIVAARDATGASAEYVLAVRSDSAGTYREVSGDDAIWAALANIALSGASLAGEHGAVTGSTAAAEVGGTQTRVSRAGRPISTDQSNTSILFDDREVLKVYRRLRPGQHPERELLEGLTLALMLAPPPAPTARSESAATICCGLRADRRSRAAGPVEAAQSKTRLPIGSETPNEIGP